MRHSARLLGLVFLCTLAARATAQDSTARAGNLTVTGNGKRVEFRVADKAVGVYNMGPDVAKPYLWPLLTPSGAQITRDWPMIKGQAGESTDHVHQKSAWFCHGDVIPEGMTLKDAEKVKGIPGVDFWDEAKGHGNIVSVGGLNQLGVEHSKIEGAKANFVTKNEWQTAEGTKILDEIRIVQFYAMPDAYLYVFDTQLTASAVPITFGDTKEGSFGIRINDAIREQKGKGKLENADGKVGERNVWGQHSAWCDYSGKIGDDVVGLAIFDDPANKYPACWHSRGYGLMAANPFGREKSGFPAMKGRKDLVKLAKGESLHLRYGLLVHMGDAKSGHVAEEFDHFVKLRGRP